MRDDRRHSKRNDFTNSVGCGGELHKSTNPFKTKINSSGPGGKMYGTVQELFNKYSMMAKKMRVHGDSVLAQSFWQHVEHYARMMVDRGYNPLLSKQRDKVSQSCLVARKQNNAAFCTGSNVQRQRPGDKQERRVVSQK